MRIGLKSGKEQIAEDLRMRFQDMARQLLLHSDYICMC